MSHSGRRALVETAAATLSGGSSCNKQHGKDKKKKTSKKPTGVKPKPSSSSAKKIGGGGGYGHGHKQKGGDCVVEFTHKQAGILLALTDTDKLHEFNQKVITAIIDSKFDNNVQINMTESDRSSFNALVYETKSSKAASVKKTVNATFDLEALESTSLSHVSSMHTQQANTLNTIKNEHLENLKKEIAGLRAKLNEQSCTSRTAAASAAPEAKTKQPQNITPPMGGQKSSFLTR
jgi:hypothetical protein